MRLNDIDLKDRLELLTFIYGEEEEALENITYDMVKQDNIECCVCLDYHWGVKLPNCSHYICAKCYYKLNNGYISADFHSNNPEPKCPTIPKSPNYPYQNKEQNKELLYSITNDKTHLDWFINENEDLYNSIKINSEFVKNVDINLKMWFNNNELIKQYNNDLIKFENDYIKYEKDMDIYNIYNMKYEEEYEEEKYHNSKRSCPLCRSEF